MRVLTNRLNRRLQERLNELKTLLNKSEKNLKAVEESLPEGSWQRASLADLRFHCESFFNYVYHDLVHLHVTAADHAFCLDSLATDLKQRLAAAEEELSRLRSYTYLEFYPFFRVMLSLALPWRLMTKILGWTRLYKLLPGRLREKLHRSESQATPILKLQSIKELAKEQCEQRRVEETGKVVMLDGSRPQQRELEKELVNDIVSPTYNFFSTVDNTGTAFEIFDDWVSLFHHEGRRYGTKQPVVHDSLHHLEELDRIIPFRDKRVLEIGAFEGANTKQLIDLGASHVVGIEANPEFFLKCVLMKNEFGLNNIEFIYGDTNKILAEPRFRQSRWFDICLASGVLYHMEDPLYLIDLLTACAPIIYVWTQVASEKSPAGPWREIKDSYDRVYRARTNTYRPKDAWGGVAPQATWIAEDDMLRAFTDRGFRCENLLSAENVSGRYLSFIAKKDQVALGDKVPSAANG